MRKIEREMIEAIKTRKDFTEENTTVWVWAENRGFGLIKVKVLLHGNLIAKVYDKSLYLCDCGYQTKITKSRLNAILSHFGFPLIYANKKQWYIGDEVWTGNKTFLLINEEDKLKESLKYAAVLGGQSQPRPYDAVLGGKR